VPIGHKKYSGGTKGPSPFEVEEVPSSGGKRKVCARVQSIQEKELKEEKYICLKESIRDIFRRR
jgi:hypothetical protein